MHLAYEYGVKNIWIVNVGDIKPMEFPISFFLDYAWDPSKWNEDNLRSYYTNWASDQFGSKFSKDIGDLIRKYSQIAARRKPELLDANTYSPKNYQEAVTVNYELLKLTGDAARIGSALPKEYFDSYYQLVLHPLKALTNLYNLYFFAAKGLPTDVQRTYINDSLITREYHHIANGKWNYMMSQTHIGYTSWQQPPVNKMPEVKYTSATEDSMDVAILRSNSNFPKGTFSEIEKHISMEAEHWTRILNSKNIQWKVIPDIGKTGSGVTTFPVTLSASATDSPRIEYDFYTVSTGEFKVDLFFSPTLNFHNDEGSKFAVSIDNEQPQIISLNKEDNNVRTWEKWVANNIIIKTSTHSIKVPGKHTLKYWMISPAVILQKVVVDFGGVKPSYLGPPETRN